ncbi:uncharacterized protein DS421_8g225950 [Arachis hypogaea]|nr:uncharacterized protein DS421_8g225950 [Arachis hypogaea]
MCPLWLKEEAEWGTWMFIIPLVCFNIVEFYLSDRVKGHFNGEQLVFGDLVNVDMFLTTTGRGEDIWWPTKLCEWYDRWSAQFGEGDRISIQSCFNYRPTHEYWESRLREPDRSMNR